MTIQEYIFDKFGKGTISFESTIDLGVTGVEYWEGYVLRKFDGENGVKIVAFKVFEKRLMYRVSVDHIGHKLTVEKQLPDFSFEFFAEYTFTNTGTQVGLKFERGTNLLFDTLYQYLTNWRDFAHGFFWVEK